MVQEVIQSFIMGPARRMIILFFPTGLAFESCEIGVFFTDSHKKKMKRAENRENFAQNRNSEIGHREVVKTPENILLKKCNYG